MIAVEIITDITLHDLLWNNFGMLLSSGFRAEKVGMIPATTIGSLKLLKYDGLTETRSATTEFHKRDIT